MAADQEQFYQILTTLLSTDNNIRTQAEELYNSLPVEAKISHLLGAIHNAGLGDEARQMSAVLLRRLFANDFLEFFPKLPPASQAQLKEQVLLAIQQDQTEQLRHKVCEVAAEVARNLIDDDGNNQWPEFLQFLFQCANAPNNVLKEAALQMFTSVPGVFGNQQNNYLDLIKQMLMQSLAPTEAYEVRFQAVRAVGSFLLIHDKETQILKHFGDLLAPMLNVIAESVQQQDDDTLLKVLIDLAENTPKYLRPQLLPIYDMCMKIFSDAGALDSWRQLALEVMVTLAEMAPAMVRKNAGKYMEQLIPLILQFMADLEEEEGWAEADEILDEDNDANNVVAEAALDRLACGLGGKVILPLVTQNVPAMLASPDWKQRHAALMALSTIGEGCHKQMEGMLPQIMDGVPGVMEGVLRYLQDPHPRVRYAACNTIGQLSTDFAPVFEKKFHDRVVPGLLMLLDDNCNPRVQAHAGAALVNFAEDCPKHILTTYLDSLMSKLEGILTAKFKELVEKGTKLVLEQVVTTIASVADTAENEFIAYYDRLMPCLKYIIQNANKDELKLLRGKTIECVTLIGMAVGPEKFMSDATEVMDMLLKTHGEGAELPDDDPQTSYLISAWSRICKVLGKNFEQYLPLVMGPVMRTAAMKPDVALLDNDDMQGIEGDDDWQFVSLGEQKNFGIRTAGLEDKAAACMMLVCYARELKEGFANYAEETVKLMVPMLKFYFHDGVRNAAAESLPWLLECATCKGPAFVQDMWRFICPELMKAIDTEPEPEVLMILLDSLARCIQTLGAGCLDQEAMTELLRIIDKLMNEHFERADDRHKKHLDEDYDEVVQEQLEDEESDDIYVLSKIADVIHSLFLSYREAFIPFFDQICTHFVNLLTPNRPWADRQWGICVFDDVIEFTGPACAKYQGFFLQPLALYVKDKSHEVRQAAAYGWGVLAQFGGEQFAGEVAKIIPSLVEVINDSEAKEPRNINATENAVAAVTKIMKYNPKGINVDEILPVWFSWLPIIEEVDEAPHVYGYLCDLVEQNNPHVLGAGNANIPRIVTIIAEAFFREVIEPSKPEGYRMVNLVRQVQSNESYFQSIVQTLAPELQHALHVALHAPPPS
ncbi:importin-5 [Tribolium castaneum]|uniref:Importin-5-like Protein n=1 Tax=Tribolium castaneum TaxID=7070 RepID=D6WJC0_TRICA|nr:PREDICTED: importin-5 [Tribolium castaneum]EFA03140.1 Importin-5-like Protein [Tribolium castaneum]|eukprot:XP_967428.1 PREDICTED: importin-5 [Tribolium castaneum]